MKYFPFVQLIYKIRFYNPDDFEYLNNTKNGNPKNLACNMKQ